MEMKKYWVNVRHGKKFLFFDGCIVYDVMQKYEKWHDPTYGNGGGEWISCDRIIKTFDNTIDAIKFRDRMNALEEGNYNARN